MPAAADEGCDITSSPSSCVEASEGSIDVGVTERQASEPGSALPAISRQKSVDEMAAAFCGDATATSVAGPGWPQVIVELCGFTGARVATAPTPAQIRRAFRELPLYRGEIRTDPETLTLVNLETYFWCGDATGRGCAAIGEGERTVTLLGQRVRIRPRIVGYAWSFGDGTGQEVTGGRAAHTYRRALLATVTLTLTWTADYALGGGAFQPIGDTTTTTSPPRLLPVREAQAVIVR